MNLKKLVRYRQNREVMEKQPLGFWVKYKDVVILDYCEQQGWEYGELDMDQFMDAKEYANKVLNEPNRLE